MTKNDVATMDPPQATEEQPAAAPAAAKKSKSRAPASTEPRTNVRVTYTDPDEFLDELAADVDLVESRLLRCTVREDPPGAGQGVTTIDVIAGYVARGQVLELVHRIGTDWHTENDADLATRSRRDELARRIAAAGVDLGLDVRGGRFGSL